MRFVFLLMMKQSPEEESSEEESGSEWEVEEILDERNTGDEKEYTKKRKSNLRLIFLFEKVFDQVEGLARGSCDVADARGLQELDDGACRMGSQEKEQAG